MSADHLLLILALLAYLLGALHYLLDVVSTRLHVGVVATAATLAGLALHTSALAVRLLRGPGGWSPSESLSVFAWAVVLIYLAAEVRYRNRVLGAFVLPIVLVAGSAAAALPDRLAQMAPGLRGPGFLIHVTLAIFGNAAFALTFVAGTLYLLQERQLKSRHFGSMRFRLPSLELLDQIGISSILVGFPLLTLALISGAIWAEQVRGSFFQLRLREVWSVVSWVLYAGLLYARVSAGWRGRKAALLSILGFCLVLFTFVGLKLFRVVPTL